MIEILSQAVVCVPKEVISFGELVDTAAQLGNIAMQAWGFHITGGLAVLGWSATTRGTDHAGFPTWLAVLISGLLGAFLCFTLLNALAFGNRTETALWVVRDFLLCHNLEKSGLNSALSYSSRGALTLGIIAVDIFVVLATGLLLSKWKRPTSPPAG